MLTLEEAQRRCLGLARKTRRVRVRAENAVGRVLSEEVIANAPLPHFDASAMDGYAVRASEFSGVGPWTFPVSGEVSAGVCPGKLPEGAVLRIFTGAPIPAGADTVVMQEDVSRVGNNATFAKPPALGKHIRRAGEDLASGAVALAAGTRVGAGALALLAMLDRTEVLVHERPRVSLLCTGDELRPVGGERGGATIPDSNSAPLRALLEKVGATVSMLPLVSDSLRETEAALRDALGRSDLLLTVGGVSVGDHDHVRTAFEAIGGALDFWKVAIKPGKPLAVSQHEGTVMMGLPGNPASALVTFLLFGAPLVRAMQGDARPTPPSFRANLSGGRPGTPGRTEVVRVRLETREGELWAVPVSNASSGNVVGLALSDAVALVPECGVRDGERVLVIRWDDL